MEIGKYNKLPHYAVHGDATCMYLWVNEDGGGESCEWIKGRKAFTLWHTLEQLLKKNNKLGFINELKHHHRLNRRVNGRPL